MTVTEHDLVCHPERRDEFVQRIHAALERTVEGLRIAYTLEGALSELVIPFAGPTRAGDKLWQHTCFEIFVSSGMPAYREFNFSPSGEWAAYAFEAYRRPVAAAIEQPILSVRKSAASLELEARIPLAADAPISVAVSAVIESRSGKLSYWALKHPPGKPDFHHPDGFALQL